MEVKINVYFNIVLDVMEAHAILYEIVDGTKRSKMPSESEIFNIFLQIF